MRVSSVLVGLLSLAGLVGLVLADDDESEQAARRVQFVLQFGDADIDGVISLDEFTALVRRGPRLKGKPELIKAFFDRIDSDHNGTLSPKELEKMPPPGQGGGPFAKKKAAFPPAKPKAPVAAQPSVDGDRPITPAERTFFETKIRPVLATRCYECHSRTGKSIKASLVLDSRDATRQGGDSGPAIVPGRPEESLLIQAIRHEDEDLQMPPKTKLPVDVIADFERWVAMGAPDPRTGGATAAPTAVDLEKGRQFWAFQPPKSAAPPPVRNELWPRTDIDRFLLARLEAKGLKPVGDAEKHALVRRVYFDLIGLPPTPEEVEAFVADRSPSAFESVVDRLLASPRFGERWGRHWLDVARYAETSGKQVNFNYPNAWRYRDYVIAAFNADKPFDRFIKEQVAGDLLPADGPRQRAEQTVATGFLALGPKSHVERVGPQFRMDLVDEQIDATSQAFLGLTVACARCHDHKFDPIPQKDYYALAGIFRSTETCYGTIRFIQNNNPSTLIALAVDSGQPAGTEPLSPEARKRMQAQIDDLRALRIRLLKEDGGLMGNRQGLISGARLAMLVSQLNSFESDGTPRLSAMGVRDRAQPSDSPIYQRGEIDKPGEVVPRGVVPVVSRKVPVVESGSGRLELAEWLSSRENPLPARVLVNRVWLHLFGRGLVPTPDNFGAAGQPPTHPELLDTLAISFMDEGWSVKSLIRKIVLSRAYQLGSQFDAKNHEVDPDNALVWRMSKRRLEAEAVRDAMLALSGQLNLSPPKGSPVSRAGEGNSNPLMRAGAFDARLSCRSVYLPVFRNNVLESLALFDFPDSSLIVAERATTTVPSQGLYLLNSPFVLRQAEALADRLLADDDRAEDRGRIRQAYLRLLGRPPSDAEVQAAENFLSSPATEPAANGEPGRSSRRAAWAAFCQALFASAEFLYRS